MWRDIWKDPVWSTIIATVILAGAGVLGAYLFDLWAVIGSYWSKFSEFSQQSNAAPNWLVWLVALVALPTVLVAIALVWGFFRPKSDSTRHWMSYTSDTFYTLLWRWQYLNSQINNLNSFCPDCDFQVFYRHVSGFIAIDVIGFHCDGCGRDFGEFNESYESLESKVRRSIQQKIRNNTWQPDRLGPN